MKRFKVGDPVEIKIVTQGQPKVNHAYIRAFSPKIAVVDIDMASKYCEVSAVWGGTDIGVFIDATSESLYLLEVEGESTLVEFPQFAGYLW